MCHAFFVFCSTQSKRSRRRSQVGRQMAWAHTVRAFVLRYAVVNAFATCRQLGLCKETTSMCRCTGQATPLRHCGEKL